MCIYIYIIFTLFSVTIPMLLFLLLCCSHARVFVWALMPFIWISPFDQLMFPYLVYLAMYILWKICMTRCTMTKCCLSYMYTCSFLFSVTVPMLFFPPNFAVLMREWLGERSSSFPIAVLGGALRLMLGFRIFQPQCSWSFMYMNIIISPFDQRMGPYLIHLAMVIL